METYLCRTALPATALATPSSSKNEVATSPGSNRKVLSVQDKYKKTKILMEKDKNLKKMPLYSYFLISIKYL
jgi:hypothetical protein